MKGLERELHGKGTLIVERNIPCYCDLQTVCNVVVES